MPTDSPLHGDSKRAKIAAAITAATDKQRERSPSNYDAAAVKRLLAERDRLRQALERIVNHSGTSGYWRHDYMEVCGIALAALTGEAPDA